MRMLLTVIWAAVLLIFTCSLNFNLLIRYHIINFRFNPSPDWSELLRLDLYWSEVGWIIRKIGHFIGFFILALLASNFGKIRSAFLWCLVYAAFTEVLQLFFFRGGRIYDVVNDGLGILLAYLCCELLFSAKEKASIQPKQ
ncbi:MULTISPECIES: VanZ family protein [Paenibacillus]|uniref:VanZ family protein n=1 Tax=Paenibacillus campinasensis TaxID=66347 RepID=A0A268EZ90_9BACL|nr:MULTISPECIES: VanZ family protein [Paenibacillus]MUG65126.1 VanZ family protein [Paenibacillus campinasensis]PAD78394.1 hypothetical protein CHH67_06420 [Paenibacillus campinasensis]PAK52318.1 hypothetical protein CHH75_12465 [Paenibacillus sp. 7541]